MFLLMQPYPGAGSGTPPSGDPVTVSYPAFQIVPVAFFSLFLMVVTQALMEVIARGR
jgi:hypothetical protein